MVQAEELDIIKIVYVILRKTKLEQLLFDS